MTEKSNKPYSARRWTDIPKPTVIGKADPPTEQEQKRIDETVERLFRQYGVLKDDETYDPEKYRNPPKLDKT